MMGEREYIYIHLCIYIRRPLCLAWGGGVREEQSQSLTAPELWPAHFVRVRWRHVFRSVQLSSVAKANSLTAPELWPAHFVRVRWRHVFRSVQLRSVANDLPFLSVQVRLLIYLLRSVFMPATVCIFTVSKLRFRHREARLQTHGFWFGFRWCSAFSHPSPTTSCFCLCRFGCVYTCYTCYGPLTCLVLCILIPATVHLPVLYCVF